MRALLISPRPEGFLAVAFPETLALTGKKLVAPPLGLITAAALLPADWELRLVDLGLRAVTEAHWQWADIVLLSGNYLQRRSLFELVREAKRRGKPVVAGGPFVSSVPEQVLEAGADFVIRGEAENTVPAFLDAIQAGVRQGVFHTDDKPDMSLSPLPRVDLLSDISRYFYMSVQTTRGCPFNCEFCDVIALNGRIPRFKTAARVLQELDAVYRLGWRGPVFLADDNFIGNKANARAILDAMIPWQKERGDPFSFFTQASVNLGQDKELVDLMTAANFGMVLMGVETPDEDVLLRTRKTQNVRNPLLESVTNVTRNGLPVMGTFMLGFDGETKGAGQRITELVEQADIPVATAFTLWAIPHTSLWDRLEQEGRLLANAASAENVFGGGFNFVPQRPASEVLDEFVGVWDYLHEPSRFLARTYRCFLKMRPTRRAMAQEAPSYRVVIPAQAERTLRARLWDLKSFLTLVWRMGIRPPYRMQFWKQLIGMVRQNPSRVWQYICTCATGLDMFRFRKEFLRMRGTWADPNEAPRMPRARANTAATR
jgi:radical SAM superfamily enzyme YgiQ (UPF0313 family)